MDAADVLIIHGLPNLEIELENGHCSHYFGMSEENHTLNAKHPVVAGDLPVEKVDYLCGAAIFRRPEDVITITGPDKDNANLFINMMRWLSPKVGE